MSHSGCPSSRSRLAAASLLLALTLLAGCGSAKPEPKPAATPAPASSAPAPAPAPAKKDPVKIGLITTTSGLIGSVGQTMERGARLAVEQINADGDIAGAPVELVVRDDKGKADEGIKAMRDMIASDKVSLFFGIASSSVALALGPVAQQENVVLLTSSTHGDEITGKNFNANVFRVTDNAYMRNRAAAKIMASRYANITRWANLSPDYAYGHNTWDDFLASLKEFNPKVEVVSDQWPAFGAPDFKNQISATLAAKPQAVFSSLFATDGITMAKQAEPYDFFKQVPLFLNPSDETDIAIALGNKMHAEWAGVHYYYKAFDNAMNKRFVADYQKKHNDVPTGYVSETYTAVWAYKTAIEKAGSTQPQKVLAALSGLSFDSVTGQRTIRPEDHQAIKAVVWIRIEPTTEAPGWKVAEWVITPGDEVKPPLKK